MTDRFIFTVTAGRSGQASLCGLLSQHVPRCYAAFEEPSLRLHFKGVLGDAERRFRRRFIETHELLGRGKVLEAHARQDDAYLERIAAKRLRRIKQDMTRTGAVVYVDVSKFFARGLYRGFARLLPEMSLIRLVRDPLLNMRSFLNRKKNFLLDNARPDAAGNLLRLPPDKLEKGELYLWAWCEMYLRYDRMLDEFNITHAAEIRTEHLTDADRMAAHLEALGLAHRELVVAPPTNTNYSQGLSATRVGNDDVRLFERFVDKLPADIRRQIRYFDDYDPMRNLSADAP